LTLEVTLVNVYSFSDYDSNGTLRVSPWMWFWIIFSMRHVILWLGLSISHTMDMMDDLTNETHWAFLLCGIPPLILLLDAGFRVPEAGRLPRRIWHSGRWLLLAAIILHVLIAIGVGMTKPEWQVSLTQMLFLGLDVLGLRFVFKSPRVRDVFADFPANPKAA